MLQNGKLLIHLNYPLNSIPSSYFSSGITPVEPPVVSNVDNDIYTVMQWSDAIRTGAWHPQNAAVLKEILPIMLKQRPFERASYDASEPQLPALVDDLLVSVAHTIHPRYWGNMLLGECPHQPLQTQWRHKIANFVDRTPSLLRKIPLPDMRPQQEMYARDTPPLDQTQSLSGEWQLPMPDSYPDRQSIAHGEDQVTLSMQHVDVVSDASHPVRELSPSLLSLSEERLKAMELILDT